jgi:protein-tyrosine phosphatase
MAQVLVVCTGNVCRSPAAERLLAARLEDVPGISVTSAGTRALVGEPMDPQMARLVQDAGADPARFAARQVTAEEIRSADLVLTMAREHRSAVVGLEPSAVRRTFLLVELSELAASVAAGGWPPEVDDEVAARLAALPRLAPGHRGGAGIAGEQQVVDPYRRSAEVHAEAFAVIEAAVDRLVRAVR